jgi:hypothetical protein
VPEVLEVHQHREAPMVAEVEVLEAYPHGGSPLAAGVEVHERYQHQKAPLGALILYPSQIPQSIHIGASSVHNQLQSSGDITPTTN